jgi:tetratricopeptide (TPR) repeat protein
MSNALSSIVAVASHARSIIPSFRKDVMTVFDSTATASARAGATASLAVKAVVILVLAYAAWQEWRIHIIYATKIAENDAAIKGAQKEAATAKFHYPRDVAPPVPSVPQAAPIADISKSLCLETNHDYDLQIKACSDILARGAVTNENRSVAYTNRALAYSHKGDRQHMLEDVNQAINLDDKNAEAYNIRAIAYATEDPARALSDLTTAINLKPNHAMFYRNRARIYSTQLHDDTKAQADFDQAKRLDGQ